MHTAPPISSTTTLPHTSRAHHVTTVLTTCDETTLRTAITNASEDDTIQFNMSHPCTITLTAAAGGTLAIIKNLTLDGSTSPQPVTISGGDTVGVLSVLCGITLALQTLTIAHGNTTYGGGILNNKGTVTISNSTIANNSASYGGGIENAGTVTISNSTIANNSASDYGGGISNEEGGTEKVAQSIVANNTAPNGSNCSGSPTDQGYNLENGTACSFTASTSVQNANPKLDPAGLQDNGGPTQTIALEAGSPAINQIPPADCLTPTDQRGVSRPQGPGCDMGAFELVSSGPALHLPDTITVDTTGAQGATVTYTVTATDPVYPSDQLTIVCTPPSGSTFPIGATTVQCTATNPEQQTATGHFSIVVQNTLPPMLHVPGPMSVEATSPQGATVTYIVTATDPVYPSDQLTITCTPLSGSIFPIGTTTVHCSAKNPAGNTATADFTVTVQKARAPSLHLPEPITVDATSPQGIPVTYTVTATNPIYSSDQLTITCTPPSGNIFPIGVTTVHCTVKDPVGNTSTGDFQVTVQNKLPPVLHLPDPITVEATSLQGAVVTYTVTATDPVYPPEQLTITCAPASGRIFPIGATTVQCQVTNPVGTTTTGNFPITVQKTTAPTLHLSNSITTDAASAQGAVVFYTVTATDLIYPPEQLTLVCLPGSGTTFLIGTTTVHCTASDPIGNTTTGWFQVVVKGAAAQISDLITLVTSFHLSMGLQTSLNAKLRAALSAVNTGNMPAACGSLTAFINQVEAQSGKGLTPNQATQLRMAAQQIKTVLACSQ